MATISHWLSSMRYHLLLLVYHLFLAVTGGMKNEQKNHFSFGYERAAWTPLTLTEATDYYSVNDLNSLIRIPSILPLPHCKEAGICDTHPFTCSSKEKESLFMRHKSTTSSPIETWKTLIHAVKLQGTNTIFLIGDSLSFQHTVDAVFLTESAGYQFTLHKEHGGEVIVQIENADPLSNITNSRKESNRPPYLLVVYISADGRMHALRDDLHQFNTAYKAKIVGTDPTHSASRTPYILI